MKAMEWKHVDKSDWNRGEWDDEPDKKQWVDPDTNMPCLIRRAHHGALCGYVGVAKDHPYYGKGYEEPPVDVHGGLTYADRCQPSEDPSRGICHLVEDGEDDDIWWFGFDCAHSMDLTPENKRRGWYTYDDVYRNIGYVENQVRKLARQLAELR